MINALEVVELAGILQRAIGEDVLFSEALPELRTFRSYNRALRRVVQNVHNARSYAETERYWNEMQSIIRYGLAEAIREGAIQGGLKSGVIPSSDRLPLDMRISTEILLSTDFINAAWDTSKTKGGTQADLTRGLRRADMWANRWKELKSLAAAIAGRVARRDGTVVQNLRWDFGKTREHCFVAGTMVLTASGERTIESIEIGDHVWTRAGWKPVTMLHEHRYIGTMAKITANGRTVEVTPEHRFWTDRGWVRADDLVLPDRIYTAPSMEYALVDRIENTPEQDLAVYNLSVADKPEYLANGMLAHNCRDCSTYVGRVYKADIWFKWGALPQSRALECRGFLCQCKLTPTDERAMPGHPPKPTNAGMF